MDDDAILDLWVAYQSASGSTAKSIRERLIVFRALLKRVDTMLLTVTRHDLVRDLGRPGLAASTRSRYKSDYHGLFTWIQEEGFRLDNPAVRLPKVRVPRPEPDPVTTEDLEYLLASGIYRRTRMWVLLYAYQGFRAQEISAVRGDSIDWNRRRLLSLDAKNGKEVWRPIHPLVWDELQKWRTTGWLFPSPQRPAEHITPNNVSRVLSAAMKRAGINHRPHQMRAWFATEMIDAGASTVIVATAMRHADMQSIPNYVRVSDDAVAEAMALLPRIHVPERSGRRVA